MQDTTLKTFGANPTAVNSHVSLSVSALSAAPSLPLFEEGLRVRLEAFALDAQTPLEHSLHTDLETIQEQLEIQLIQLRFLLNDIRVLRWVKEVKS